MGEPIKIGIVGYGNIGRGVESAIDQNQDMILEAIFTRRNPDNLKTRGLANKILNVSEADKYTDSIDVLILCGGSAVDLPKQGPFFAAMFNTVDSFDTHAKIPEYFGSINSAAKKSGKVCVISTGWDPGLFSLLRVIEESVLPNGKSYTFWGKGVSQGHSDAIRKIKGVKDARQYTIPVESAVEKVRLGKNPELSIREKHLRDCYVCAEDNQDLERIEREIKTMPYYFEDYDTQVTFISEEEMAQKHSGMSHGAFVMRSGKTVIDNNHLFPIPTIHLKY